MEVEPGDSFTNPTRWLYYFEGDAKDWENGPQALVATLDKVGNGADKAWTVAR